MKAFCFGAQVVDSCILIMGCRRVAREVEIRQVNVMLPAPSLELLGHIPIALHIDEIDFRNVENRFNVVRVGVDKIVELQADSILANIIDGRFERVDAIVEMFRHFAFKPR